MPIYEYKCKSCGKIVEVIQKMDDAPLTTCEACSGKLEKIVSRTSFQLSGGGWYSSGYSKGGSSSSDSSGGSSDSVGSKDSKSESKPDAAKDTKKTSGGGCGPACGCH